ncbi:hypothetical protein TSUD_282640 [Trifolium subterraneum]|uniref:Uncharacterized protein n=1 Tax=Trifolium subterraneum TaxID=3900 RepID=A0A2Z6PDB0_TRISU|nr:hypothetical protein TSUD_282640 [Trifolium subterraneum]
MDYSGDGRGVQFEENVENVMGQDIPHEENAPEMESFPAPQFDENVLAEMVSVYGLP